MIDRLKRHAVQVLLRAGHTQKEAARFARVSLRTVQRIASEPPAVDSERLAVGERPAVGRPSKVEEFRRLIMDSLAEEPGMASAEILRRVRSEGYTGGKTALYALVASLREERQIFAGALTEHDCGRCLLEFLGGLKKRIHFVVTRLVFSGWVLVSIVSDLKPETLIRTMLAHFKAVGGIPLVAVFRHPQAAQWVEEETFFKWAFAFADVTFRLGVGADFGPALLASCGRLRGQRLSGWVRKSLSHLGPFHDEVDLVNRLNAWVEDVNHQKGARAAPAPAALLDEDCRLLRPLPVEVENLALRIPVCVRSNATVVFEDNLYMMPTETANMCARLHLYEDRVCVVVGGSEVWHPRRPARNPH